jgi:hypothetical protein
VSIPLFRFRCPHPPHIPGFVPTGVSCRFKSGLKNPRFSRSRALRDPPSVNRPSWIPARAGHRPDASPRDTLTRATLPVAPPPALPPLRPPDTSCLAPSPSPTASHPRVGTGNAIAAFAARRSGDPATDPHSGTRDSMPSPWPLRGQRLRRKRLRRERLRRNQCPARFFGSSAECAFPSPPLRFCSSVQRVACLPNRLASSRRG